MANYPYWYEGIEEDLAGYNCPFTIVTAVEGKLFRALSSHYGRDHYAGINSGLSNVNWNALAECSIGSQVWMYDQLNEQTKRLDTLTVNSTEMRTYLNSIGAYFDSWQSGFPSSSRGPMPPLGSDDE